MPSFPVTLDPSFTDPRAEISALSVRYAPESESLAQSTLKLSIVSDPEATDGIARGSTLNSNYILTQCNGDGAEGPQSAKVISSEAKDIECVLCWDESQQSYVLKPLAHNLRVSASEARKAGSRVLPPRMATPAEFASGDSDAASPTGGSNGAAASAAATRRTSAPLRRSRPISQPLITPSAQAKRTSSTASTASSKPAPKAASPPLHKLVGSKNPAARKSVGGKSARRGYYKQTEAAENGRSTSSGSNASDVSDADDDDDDDDFGDLANELADDLEKASTPQPHLNHAVRVLGTAGTAVKRNGYDEESSSEEE